MVQRAVLTQLGWDTPLEFRDDDAPPSALGVDEVLVEVAACGVAHRDLVDRSGRLPFMQVPIVQGHEFAGRVIALGSAVSRWQVGDRVGALHRDHCGECPRCLEGETGHCLNAARVFGITVDGGYASHVVAAESALYPLPNWIALDEAAVVNSTFGTAFRALNRFGSLTPGQRVLVTGANGGVGIGAIQIARAQGADVIAVVRDAAHGSFVEELGASVVVDDGTTFHKRVPGGQVDVVLDCVGSPTFNSSLRCVRLGGALALVGNVSEARAELNMGRIVVGDVRICGSTGATPRDLERLLALMERHPMRIVIAARHPLSEADPAQRLLRAGGQRGRLLLVPNA